MARIPCDHGGPLASAADVRPKIVSTIFGIELDFTLQCCYDPHMINERNTNYEVSTMNATTEIRSYGNGSATLSVKVEIDPKIKAQMDAYRVGFACLPADYVQLHQQLAIVGLREVESRGAVVLKTELVDDGWMDGMRVLRAVVETPSRRLIDLRWHDSGCNGGYFMEKLDAGQGTFDINSIR